MRNLYTYLTEERKHKYNSITKVKKVLGNRPSDKDVKDFIKTNYDMNNSDHADIVGDIIGYYKIAPEEMFDENGELLENILTEMTYNDPVMIALRSAKMKRDKQKKAEDFAKSKRVYGKQRKKLELDLDDIHSELNDLYTDRAETYRDMEEEAGRLGDDWNDKEANKYGKELNKIESKIEKLLKKRNKLEIKLAY